MIDMLGYIPYQVCMYIEHLGLVRLATCHQVTWCDTTGDKLIVGIYFWWSVNEFRRVIEWPRDLIMVNDDL